MEDSSPQVKRTSTRQDAQKELVEKSRRIAGVAEAMQVHDAVVAYLVTPPARVAWMHYATGGNQT